MSGGRKLNVRRERTVMELIGAGATYSEVAKIVGITRCTVAGIVHRFKKRGQA